MVSTSSIEQEAGGRKQEAGSRRQEAEETCPLCRGMGYLRADVPVGHPDFGKLVPCTCHLAELAQRRVAALRTLSDLEILARITFETFVSEGHGLPPDKQNNLRWAYEEARTFA